MAAQWGVFLCNCLQTLSIDPQRLDLPTSCVYLASDPDTDLQGFAELASHERCDRILIGCCADPGHFDDTFSAGEMKALNLHFVNLKESCFLPHPDIDEAYAKASRLIRAAVQSADAQVEPTSNPLHAGGRVLIETNSVLGQQLAWQLKDVARPVLVIPEEAPGIESTPSWRVYQGRVLEVKGRLGDFQVTITDDATSKRQELQVDQVVIITQNGAFPTKARTGCHLLRDPDAGELEQTVGRIRDLIGDFFKTVHITYRPDICAGGTADQEACGVCIPACPYDVIRRDAENHLRMAVDHMACEGCGACVSACPTSALRFTEPSPEELYTRLAALLAPLPNPPREAHNIILFHCGEQGRRVLQEAGRRSLPYPATVLPVEVPCLRYVSEANLLAAFRLGAAGVGLLGCETCQHGERQQLFEKLDFCQVTLDAFGFGADRLQLMTADDNTQEQAIARLKNFAETVDPAPVQSHGHQLRQTGNREVIAEAIAAFIEQVGEEPGQRQLSASHPFAFAEVQEAGCTLCRSCVNVCPAHAFKLEESTSSLQFKHLACVACGLCETVCPENVITLRHEIYFDRAALDYQTVVQDDMVACAHCGKPYINRKALEAVESRVLSIASLIETFSGQRRNLLRMCPDCRAVSAMLEVEKGWEP